jgi:long-chain acyl-CoA synthetase
MNIASTIAHGRRHYPERPAIRFDGRDISYAALDRTASRMAGVLRGHAIGRGDRVALLLPNVPAFAVAYFGALKLGAVVVSINTGLSGDELRFALADSGAIALVTTRDREPDIAALAPQPPALRVLLIADADGCGATVAAAARASDVDQTGDEVDGVERLDAANAADASDTVDAIDLEPDAPAVIVYTSGTTGEPKGATLSHGNVAFAMAAKQRYLEIRPDDRLLLFLPLYHCFGQNAILNAGLYAGATIVLQRGFDVSHTLAALAHEGVTMLFGVPATFIVLQERLERGGLGALRYCFSAAAPLPVSVETAWTRKFGLAIHQGYGLTETSPFASYNHVTRHRPGSIGAPIDAVSMRVVDVTTGEPLPAGAIGEIVIHGPNVMLGYWNRPRETAEAIRDGWFHTGDIGRMDADGYFFLEDRLKDMIIVGGSNVYPAEIESVLHQHPSVAEAAVFGVPDPVLGEQVRAAIVLATAAATAVAAPEREHELIAWCRTRLAAFKVPTSVELVDALPRNRTGKVLKRVLRDRHAAAATARAATDATTSATRVSAVASSADRASAETIQRWIAQWLAHNVANAEPSHASAGSRHRDGVGDETVRADASNVAFAAVASGAGADGGDASGPTRRDRGGRNGERDIDLDRPLIEYGVTSVIAVALAMALGAWLDRPVPATIAWHHPTIRALARQLAARDVVADAAPMADAATLAAMTDAAAEAMLIDTLARLRG